MLNASGEFSLQASVFRDRFSKGVSFYNRGLVVSDCSVLWVRAPCSALKMCL